jgi:hypothetical protein
MAEPLKKPTHTAYAFRREGKKMRFGRWLEVGTGRSDKDGIVHVFLDRLPIGGFTGYVYLAPVGAELPPEPQPERPGSTDHDSEENAES